ncbi:hypothetical protein [Kyrpidia spormannii]|uniref:hypothetical protein n=1 Tax=Kyrpidia spormannii TaxID=2055160 RepID=UPI001056C0A8|nr:hypothetical protein [Kyrpidia spormannii]
MSLAFDLRAVVEQVLSGAGQSEEFCFRLYKLLENYIVNNCTDADILDVIESIATWEDEVSRNANSTT